MRWNGGCNLRAERAMACKEPAELMGRMEKDGFALTKDEAEAYIAELSDFELDDAAWTGKAGDGCYFHCPTFSYRKPQTDEANHQSEKGVVCTGFLALCLAFGIFLSGGCGYGTENTGSPVGISGFRGWGSLTQANKNQEVLQNDNHQQK